MLLQLGGSAATHTLLRWRADLLKDDDITELSPHSTLEDGFDGTDDYLNGQVAEGLP